MLGVSTQDSAIMIRLWTLGLVDLSGPHGDERLRGALQPKRLALLTFLAVDAQGAFHRRDSLVALLWPELDQARAHAALRKTLHHLRRLLGADLFVSRPGDDVRLDGAGLWCDAREFGALAAGGSYAQSLELYRGDFLTGFHVPDAPEFEHWLDAEQHRLRGTATECALHLAADGKAAGRVVEAVRWARRAVEIQPLEEGPNRLLIELLDESGDRAAAVRAYERYSQRLARELDLTPGDDTRRVAQRLRRHGPPATQDTVAAAGIVLAAENNPVPAPDRVSPWQRFRVGGTALALVVTAAVGGLILKRFTASDAPIRSLAVLPLENLTGDQSQEYLVEGIHDALIGQLAQITALRVISRTSAMAFEGRGKSVPEIARALSVDAVVEGSVSRTGDTIQIEVDLIGARPERHLWSHVYERQVRDVPVLQREVARDMAAQLRLTPLPSALVAASRDRAVEPEAYDAWLKGVYHASRRTGADLDTCIRYGKSAAATDPTYAPAYQLLAECYDLMTFVASSPPEVAFENAKAAARQALALDQTLAGAHSALAYALAYHDWDWAGANRAYQRALALDPRLESAQGDYGFFLAWLGRYDEAMGHVRQAERLSPVSPEAAVRVAMVAYLARHYDEAIAEARRAIGMDSGFMFAYDRLHWAYEAQGKYADAVAAAERAAELAGPGDLRRRAFLAHAYAVAGRHKEAQAILNDLLATHRGTYVPPIAIAAAYLGLGNRARAMQWLERAFESRDGGMVLLNTFPLWDPLRSDPRYENLVSRMRYPQ